MPSTLARALPATILLAALSIPAQNNFLERSQAADGSWSTARWGGVARADLRVHALVMLAFLGDGNTTRKGKYRAQLKDGMRSLTKRLDDAGRFALRSDPDWLLDQAMATLVVLQDLSADGFGSAPRVARYRQATRCLIDEVTRRRPPASVEVRLWSDFVVAASRKLAADKNGDGGDAQAWARLADELHEALAALPPATATTPRELAAEALRRDIAGEDVAPPALPAEALADPLATLYVVTLRFRRGGGDWQPVAKWLERQVVETQSVPGPDGVVERGSWHPRGAFGDEHGRVGTTAVAILLLEIYYRYCCLAPFFD